MKIPGKIGWAGLIAIAFVAVLLGLVMNPVGKIAEVKGLNIDSQLFARSWEVPSTPNGLSPTQCWFSVSSAIGDTIYFTGSDHRTNSAMYKLDTLTDELVYLGDARSASEKANNWLEEETAEKFHVKPIHYRGKVYVATTDYSYLDDGYLKKRGFHWYAYDIASGEFVDLSVKEKGGVAGAHASIMSTALDAKNGYIYGVSSPHSNLYRYDIQKGITEDLGRPEFFTDPYYNASRFIWVDSRGRVYYTVSRFDHVICYDPVTGFAAEKDWQLKSRNFGGDKMIRIGQWSLDGKRCYMADYEANFYLFNDEDKSFTWLGQGEASRDYYKNKQGFRIRVLNLTADEKKIYFINDDAPQFALFEFDLDTRKTTRLCSLGLIDDRFRTTKYFNRAGHDSWDRNGRFYIASFGAELDNPTDVIMTRIDPVLLKVQLKMLKLTEVGLEREVEQLTIFRRGDIRKKLEVILEGKLKDGKAMYQTVTIPAGESILSVKTAQLFPAVDVISVIPNGNTYKTITDR